MSETQPTHFNGANYAASQVMTSAPTQHSQEKHRHASHWRRRSCGLCCILVTLLKLFLDHHHFLSHHHSPYPANSPASCIEVLRRERILGTVQLDKHKHEHEHKHGLHYDLKLEVSLNNPNEMIGIHYDELDAAAYYDEERLGWAPLPPFYQGHRNITMVYPVFSGQSVMVRSDLIATRFNEERTDGLFSMGIKILLNMRFKIGHLKTSKFSAKIWCDLMVPSASSSPSSDFTRTKCDVDYF